MYVTIALLRLGTLLHWHECNLVIVECRPTADDIRKKGSTKFYRAKPAKFEFDSIKMSVQKVDVLTAVPA